LSSNLKKSLFDAAFSHLKSGETQKALELCVTGMDKYPDDPNIFCLTGQALITLKRFEDARTLINSILKKFPKFANAQELHGDLLLLEGQFEKSVQVYESLQKLAPNRQHLIAKIERANDLTKSLISGESSEQQDISYTDELNQALQLVENGEPEKAEDIYRNVLRKNPNHSEAMRLLAGVAAKHSRYDDAEMLLLRSVQKSPNFSRAWLDLSKMQLELGKYPQALESAQKLVELTPDIAESMVALGNTQAQCNFPELAIETYSKALEYSSSHQGAFSGLAHQLKTLGRQQEAIAAHRQNIQANPQNTEPY